MSRSRPYPTRSTMLLGIVGVLALMVAGLVAGADRPAVAQVESASFVDSIRPEHPRLLATADDFTDLRSRIQQDPRSADWYADIEATADDVLDQPVSEYEFPDGRSLLTVTRRVLGRSYHLALAYQVTGEDVYAERLWDELEAAAEFPDWNPESFLSTAEMTHAFAVGYDWVYDYWTPERREVIRDAIVELGLLPGKSSYDSGEWWVNTTNNWNIVCNAGIGLGALAVADEVPELADELISNGRDSLPTAIDEYAPDGAYPEGTGYWAYATRYLGPYVSALQTALGDDLGLSDYPGLDETGHYPIYLTGTAGQSFNYYDTSAGAERPAEMFWLANTYDEPVYSWWGGLGGDQGASPRHLLWYDPEQEQSPTDSEWQLDKYFRGSEVVTSRGAWEDSTATFSGFKAGDNQTNHGDLDLGTFVFDALGTRWAVELGREDYGVPGYWSDGADGQRWTYYRKRAEGQNTLIVNPGDGPDQDPLATGEIINHESGPTESFAIAELSEAYAQHGVTSWQRGVALVDHRRQLLVQDELRAEEPVDAWWFMHTRAVVEIADDGRSALLTDGGRQLRAEIAAPAEDAEFVVMDAEPLWSSPDPPEQSANPGVRKLAIEVNDVEELTLAVTLTPVRDNASGTSELPDIEPLADWRADHSDVPLLDEITVDGAELAGFEPGNFTYDVPVDADVTEPPLVEATAADENTRLVVRQAPAVPGTAMVIATRPGSPAVRYLLHFAPPRAATQVTASIDGTFPPEYTIDDDLDTFFSAEGHGQWVQYDMGEQATVDGVALAWSQGDVRSYSFEILTSTDGETWDEAYSGSSSSETLELEEHLFESVQARYVRVVGYGNTTNDWLTLTEARILRSDGEWPQFEDTPPTLAEVSLEADNTNVAIGDSTQLQLSATMSDGSEVDLADYTVRYVSGDPSVAHVSPDGAVTGEAVGSALIGVVVTTPDRRLLQDRLSVEVFDPTSVRLTPSADVFVRGGDYADENYGSASSLTLKQDGNESFHREGFVAFDLPDIEGEIVSATLNLYGQVNESGGFEVGDDEHFVHVHAAGADWAEDTITWNSRPEVGDRVGSFDIDEETRWHTVDLTDVVAGHDPATALSLALQHEAPAGNRLPVSLRSKEAANGPYLQLGLDPESL